jgi:putrescine aminotransferase
MGSEQLFLKNKKEVFDDSIAYWNSGKTKEWLDLGIDFIMNRRQGYYFWDRDGKKLMDVHINGGIYSLGHRNEEVIAALKDALDYVDIGNHHFPSPFKAELAKELIHASPDNMRHVIYGSSGGEIVDLALKSARAATRKKKIICVQNSYHGHTGLSVAAGAERYCKMFLSENNDFIKVPFNDVAAVENAFRQGDIACVIMETIPATYGFPLPQNDYLKKVKALCEGNEALYIADEIQTGLMRSGRMWCIDTYCVVPDIIVVSKGLSGGIYPISAAILNEKASYWMTQDGSAHMASYGGSELGCVCALKVLEIIQRKSTKENIRNVSEYLRNGLEGIMKDNQDTFINIRQNGLIMGLEFTGEKGAIPVMQHLYQNGVWGIYSQLDPHVLQFKPGILCTKEYCDELLEKMAFSINEAREDILAGR